MIRTRYLVLAAVLIAGAALLISRGGADPVDDGSTARESREREAKAEGAGEKPGVDPADEQRHKALLALGLIEGAVEADRLRAVALLRELGEPALKLLYEELADEAGGSRRYAAAFAVSMLGDEESKHLVADLFREQRRAPHPLLAAAAARLEDPELAREFLALTSSPDYEVRRAVARAQRGADFPDLADLLPLLADTEPKVRDEAERSLAHLLPRMEPAEIKLATEAAVTNGSPTVKLAGLRMCRRLDTPWARKLAAKATADSSWVVREEAMQTLGSHGDPAASKPLARVLRQDVGRHEKVCAANALSNVETDKEALDALASASRDKDPMVALAASRALVARGDARGVPPLLMLRHVKESAALRVDDEDADLLRGLSDHVLESVAKGRHARHPGENWDRWWSRVREDFRVPDTTVIPAYPDNH